MEAVEVIAGLAMFAVGAVLYFVPTIVATKRGVRLQGPVLIINLLAGWTLVGWVVAAAMAMAPVDRQQPQPQWPPPDPTNRQG